MTAANATLLRLLCSWRRHVRETKFEHKAPGATSWRVTSICTSELTWLGRKATTGGIIGVVAATARTVDSIESVLALAEEGAKATSAGFAMLLALRLRWEGGILSKGSVEALQRAINKVRETDKNRSERLGPATIAAGGAQAKRLSGLAVYIGSPFGSVFEEMLAGRPVHDRLRHAVLARAHLP